MHYKSIKGNIIYGVGKEVKKQEQGSCELKYSIVFLDIIIVFYIKQLKKIHHNSLI